MTGPAKDGVDPGRLICPILGLTPAELRVLGVTADSCVLRGKRLEISLGRQGASPIDITVEPRDDASPAYARTASLSLSYRADPVPPWLTRLLDRAARRLAGLDFERIEAAHRALFPAPPGTGDGGDEARGGTVAGGQEAGGDAAAGPGPDERYIPDGLHESWAHPDRWRLFLADTEIRRGRDSVVRADLPWVYVEHGDLECQHVGTGPFVCFPWRAPYDPPVNTRFEPSPASPGGAPLARDRPGGGRIERSFVTDMADVDVIRGAIPKFRALFEGLREQLREGHEEACAVVVNCTCLPTMIGDEPEEVVREERSRCPVPILYREQDRVPYGAHIAALAGMLRDAPPVEAEDGLVNLVGFRPGPAYDELCELLAAIGVKVNVSALPLLSPPMMRAWRRARVQVVFDNADWRGLRAHLLSDPAVREVVPPQPFGPARTVEWLAAVAEATGRAEAAAPVIARVRDEAMAAWAPLAAEAARHTVGIVADPRHVPRLSDPARNWGLPLLPLLDEMGFSVRVAMYGTGPDSTAAAAIRAALPGDRHSVVTFSSPSDLADFLGAPDLDLVYSDYGFDHRITAAGKTPFSSQVFEYGVAGGQRSLERLLALCRIPFYRENARHLRRTT